MKLGSTRFTEFVRFEDEQIDDVNTIVETTGQTADLYRPQTSIKPGFEQEVGNEILVDRFLVHLARSNGVPRSASGEFDVSIVQWVALTTNKKVRNRDVLVIAGQRYSVVDILRTVRGKSELVLEKIE